MLPTVPAAGKWTKTNPCVDFFLPSMCAVPIFLSVWDIAFGKFDTAQKSTETEQSWLEQVAWREVASKRVKRCAAFVKDPQSPPLLLLVAMLHEPLRWLTGYFLHASSSKRRNGAWGCPLLCTFTSPARSPVTRVLQYFSSLLAGNAHRLAMIFGYFKQTSFEEWAASHPEELARLRRGATVAASWVYRRFHVICMGWPWRLSQCVDPNISPAEQLVVFREFLQWPVEALDLHFSQRLRLRAAACGVTADADDIAPWVRTLLLRWSWAVRMTAASVELTDRMATVKVFHGSTTAQHLVAVAAASSEAITPAPRRVERLCHAVG